MSTALDLLTRTYHLGQEPTGGEHFADVLAGGRGYDDRLTARTGFGASKLRQALKKPANRGGLRHCLNGSKYVVTELAVREWMDDPLPLAA